LNGSKYAWRDSNPPNLWLRRRQSQKPKRPGNQEDFRDYTAKAGGLQEFARMEFTRCPPPTTGAGGAVTRASFGHTQRTRELVAPGMLPSKSANRTFITSDLSLNPPAAVKGQTTKNPFTDLAIENWGLLMTATWLESHPGSTVPRTGHTLSDEFHAFNPVMHVRIKSLDLGPLFSAGASNHIDKGS
jgi:hypothetical protein